MSPDTETNGRTIVALVALACLAGALLVAGAGSAAFFDTVLDGIDAVWSGPLDGVFERVRDVLSQYLMF